MTNEQTTTLIAAIYADKQIRMAPITLREAELAEALTIPGQSIYTFVTYTLKGIGGLTPDKMYHSVGLRNDVYLKRAITELQKAHILSLGFNLDDLKTEND
ncbi:hypothetical protein [Rufibacter ruber]|uniref:hypothetical protein n=1 Tax=Rufibacter ruber TaxID=1783499 RepID=UPI00082F200F|nr:hypothetical protein [Rufibacter ruber]